jgi:hypothetical protein
VFPGCVRIEARLQMTSRNSVFSALSQLTEACLQTLQRVVIATTRWTIGQCPHVDGAPE